AVLVTLVQAIAISQSRGPQRSAVDVTNADVRATLKGAPADGNTVKVLVGPSTNGSAIRGGQSRKIGPGDVIVIPPVVAHWFSTVESDMNYLVVRVDADHVLPAGYVNPVITNVKE